MSLNLNFLDKVAKELPIIRPIKEFIHLNLLLPYQQLPFWDALLQVGNNLEALPLENIEFYREKIKSGLIPLSEIEKKLAKVPKNLDKIQVFDHIMKDPFSFVYHDSRVGFLHERWNQFLGVNVVQLADSTLIKWLGMFMDQGIAYWQMPGSQDFSFYECLRRLIEDSLFKPDPFKRSQIKMLFPEDPKEAITAHLNFLCPNHEMHEEYCTESILNLRGWAGMIYALQKDPNLLSFKRKINLTDFLAVKLILERAWIMSEYAGDAKPDFDQEKIKEQHPFNDEHWYCAFQICHEAYEEATYNKVLNEIIAKKSLEKIPISFQAVFCMDDREGPLRRFLESIAPKVETFGTAGHFGIECLYQHPKDPFPKKQCPAPIPAKYIIKDQELAPLKRDSSLESLSNHDIRPSRNFLHDWFFTYANSVKGALILARNLFFPLAFKDISNVREIAPDTKLKLIREMPHIEGELKQGYSFDEMAQVVYGELQLIGLLGNYAPLIFIFGHGSSSVNNPYFATYGCGACSGRPGAVNARALVEMANHPEVRKILVSKFQLMIPNSTHFVAGMHDTCRDVIELFNTEKVPNEYALPFRQFKKYLSLALYKNANERSQSFKLVSYQSINKDGHKEVMRRSYSLFETRPELGHTGVAFAIVGKRSMTRGVNLQRRSFLQSYDPATDPEGKILAKILSAVIPVCSGISLDYFFSRVDNLRFGAGSKLPQNVVGNIGVSHGTESDLLFGLPFQMIDQHQPLRLLVLVQHGPEIALNAIQENPLVRQIVYNNWIYYASYDEQSERVYNFKDGMMI